MRYHIKYCNTLKKRELKLNDKTIKSLVKDVDQTEIKEINMVKNRRSEAIFRFLNEMQYVNY